MFSLSLTVAVQYLVPREPCSGTNPFLENSSSLSNRVIGSRLMVFTGNIRKGDEVLTNASKVPNSVLDASTSSYILSALD